jgi:hypothetical protein
VHYRVDPQITDWSWQDAWRPDATAIAQQLWYQDEVRKRSLLKYSLNSVKVPEEGELEENKIIRQRWPVRNRKKTKL